MTNSSNAVATQAQGGTEVSNLGGMNAFEMYGSQVAQRAIVGKLLKFNKGDWLAGEEDVEIPVGTRLVANMDELLIGWIKWELNKPVQQIMGAVIDGYQPQKRAELGDHDESLWEVDENNQKPRDPWQFSNYLLMKEVGKQAKDENLFTFTTSSRGGLNAIGELCKSFGKQMSQHAGDHPIVELGMSKYRHSNPQYGIIKVPVITLVDWEPRALFNQQDRAADAPAE